jgi:hypothetical protein
MGDLDELKAGKHLDKETFQALVVFKLLTKTAEGRREFLLATSDDDRQRLFDELTDPSGSEEQGSSEEPDDEELKSLRGVQYTGIPEGVRRVLERLSDSELALLSDLDAAYVDAGMSLEGNPASLIVH